MDNERLISSVSSPWDEFRNHPGQVARLRWDLLRDFYQDVVRVNGIKLITLSELPQVYKRERKKLLKKVLKGQDSDYNGEVTRLLYNYLVSTATLIDHCRYVMQDYDGTTYYAEYKKRIRIFSGIPEVAFYKDLRNYFVHHKIPSIGLSIGDFYLDDDDFRHEALIYTSDLNDSDKWSAESRVFIQAHFPYVYIAGITKTHIAGLAELYSWIFSNFTELHGDEYAQSLVVKWRILKEQHHRSSSM